MYVRSYLIAELDVSSLFCQLSSFHGFSTDSFTAASALCIDVRREGGELRFKLPIEGNFFSTKIIVQGPNYKKILRLSYDVIITYDNRKSNLR